MKGQTNGKKMSFVNSRILTIERFNGPVALGGLGRPAKLFFFKRAPNFDPVHTRQPFVSVSPRGIWREALVSETF